jgi:hypothetical protein
MTMILHYLRKILKRWNNGAIEITSNCSRYENLHFEILSLCLDRI